MTTWIDGYRNTVNKNVQGHLGKYYHAESLSQDEVLWEALILALGTEENRRMHTILAMVSYEEIQGLSSESVTDILTGLEFVYIGLLIHSRVINISQITHSEDSIIHNYGERLTIIVGDILYELGIDILSRSGKLEIFHEVIAGFGHRGYLHGLARDVLGISVSNEYEYFSYADERLSRSLGSSLICGALLTNTMNDELYDHLHEFAFSIGRMYQLGLSIKNYEMSKSQDDISIGKCPIITLVGLEKTKEMEEELYYQSMLSTQKFRSPKFGDLIQYFRIQ